MNIAISGEGKAFKDMSIEEINATEGLNILAGFCPLDLEFIEHLNGIKMERGIFVNPRCVACPELEQLLTLDEAAVRESIGILRKAVMELWQNAQATMDEIAKGIAMLKMHQTVLDRAGIEPLEHTHNQWKLEQESFLNTEMGCLSNAVYKFEYTITEENDEFRSWKHRGDGDKVFYLTWNMSVRAAAPGSKAEELGGQMRKRFKDRDEMIAYLAGRQKKFAHCFEQGDFPPVPEKYKANFFYGGALLPGYALEEEAAKK